MAMPERFKLAFAEVGLLWDARHEGIQQREEFPHWHGFALSGSDDDPALTLFIDRDTSKDNEDTLINAVLDVAALLRPRTARMNRFQQIRGANPPSASVQVQPGSGISASSPKCQDDEPCSGTIGAFLRRTGTDQPAFLLTCHHVLLENEKKTCADRVQVTTASGDLIADGRAYFVPLNDSPQANRVDAAMVRLNHDVTAIPTYTGLTVKDTTSVRPATGCPAQKLGDASGITCGTISYRSCQAEVLDCTGENKFEFEDLIVIQPLSAEPFARDGDSGSIVVGGGLPLGLLFAAEKGGAGSVLGLACAWDNVMREIASSLGHPVEMMLTPTTRPGDPCGDSDDRQTKVG